MSGKSIPIKVGFVPEYVFLAISVGQISTQDNKHIPPVGVIVPTLYILIP
jgi:hypothetical protein